MPVPSSITDLSQTAGSNSPAGADSVFPNLDNYIRAIESFIAVLRDGKGLSAELDVASSATCDIGASNSPFARITGTTTITSFGTNYNGPRYLRFASSLTLTHNATTLILPGGANITVSAGDTCMLIPNGNPATGWRVHLGIIGSMLIANDLTMNVPATYATIQAALDYLADRRIVSGAIVTIQVADGTYSHTDTLDVSHPDGANIRIIGDTATPGNCILTWGATPNVDGIVATGNVAMPFIDGFTIKKTAKAVWPDNAIAILADHGARMNVGANVDIDNWYYGAVARHGSRGKFLGTVDNAGDVGVWSVYGSQLYAENATSNNATGTDDSGATLGFGFQAEHGSQLYCEGATATGCEVAGFAALSNSQVQAHDTVSSGNTGSGYFARDNGEIEAHGGTAASNTRYGVEEYTTGRIFYSSMTFGSGGTANTMGDKAPVVALDNTTLGARLVASSGSLRLDTADTSPTYFNTSGGLQFEVAHATSAVNHFFAQGSATGNSVVFGATGTDTNIAAEYRTKGTGSYYFKTNGGSDLQLEVFNTTGAISFLGITGSTGSSPRIQAFSSGANADILFTPKGSGLVRFGTFSASGDVACTGTVSIKTADGTIHTLMCSS